MQDSEGVTAEEIINALMKRHPAFDPALQGVGRWTCLREWCNIDLLALDAWREGQVVGYEVKVSRSDMRSELLDPSKRAQAVSMCTRFYFAVPAGLLTPEERAFEEPEWEPSDFVRTPCTNPECKAGSPRHGWYARSPKPRGPRLRGTPKEGVSIHLGFVTDSGVHEHGGSYTHHIELGACCVACKGYGTTAKSRVEREAPTLWIPRDVGLVVVGPRGCAVLREAPRRTVTEPLIPWPYIGYQRSSGPKSRREIPAADRSRLERQAINQLARWVSARPDPRHRRGDVVVDEPPCVLPVPDPEPEVEEAPNVWIG